MAGWVAHPLAGQLMRRTLPQDYGSPEQYLNTLAPLLGQQAWQGATESEGARPVHATLVCSVG